MEPAPELCDPLQRYYAASTQGDTAFLAQLIARHPGALVVGTDAAEWWSGGEQIVTTWTAAWRERGGLPVHASRPEAYRAGAVGWVADQAMWRLSNGQAVPFRLTAVFHREAQAWRMVQAHFSVGVPNEHLGETSSTG
jgi:SnoaL-like domain